MNTNKNFEEISSENLMKTTGGMVPAGGAKEIGKITKGIEEAERKERERKMAELMVATGIHGDLPISRDY